MNNIFILTVLGFFFCSCAQKIPFSNVIKKEYNLESEERIKSVQFYLSETVVLEKITNSSTNNSIDQEGNLVSNSINEIEKIIIHSNTPCVFHGFGPNNEIQVRFESEYPDRYLEFESRNGERASYYIKIDKKSGNIVRYGEFDYKWTQAPTSTFIKIRKQHNKKKKRNQRVVKGMKV
ncbi:hypothetical protein N8203_03480 [Crocinitomicaceae bacterium]|nr:hypothetical protein [Crocinitomicaceae bacterium]